MKKIDFNVNPKSYKHWKIEIEKNITRHKEIQINCLKDSFLIENTSKSLKNSEEKIEIKPTRIKKK